MQYAKKMQILPLSYEEDFGDCGFAAVGLRRKNEINAAFNALAEYMEKPSKIVN